MRFWRHGSGVQWQKQHGPHHTHEIAGGGHKRDLLTLRIAALGSLEVRTDGGRTA